MVVEKVRGEACELWWRR